MMFMGKKNQPSRFQLLVAEEAMEFLSASTAFNFCLKVSDYLAFSVALTICFFRVYILLSVFVLLPFEIEFPESSFLATIPLLPA